MKIIISSKFLRKELEKILDIHPQEVTLMKNRINFYKNGLPCYTFIVDKSIEHEKDSKIYFDYLQWKKLYKYLKLIPDQPVVIEFQYLDDKSVRVEIKNAEFVTTPKKHFPGFNNII